MAEFTILDAPETPAPIFAFRALKGVIFGSPNDDDERSKENASSPKQAPTLRSKISALRASSVSPSKRRKTNQYASPAKSILRTPGIPTPRRQNTNVTFKDVTPSLSPELTRKGPAPKGRPLSGDVKGVVVVTQPSANQAPPAPPPGTSITASKLASKVQAVPTSKAPEQTSVTFDVEAYKLSTEKEMKKLVRYGQKMREYARKQDEENTKLKIALEKLQKENEELRKREGLRRASRSGKQDQRQNGEEAGRQAFVAGPGRQMTREKEDKQLSQSVAHLGHANSRTASAARHPSGTPKVSPQKYRQISPLKRKASTQLRPESSLPHNSKVSIQPDPQAAQSDHGENAPTSGPSTARLPLERLAAARERIRLKAELRRKTTPNTSSPVNWNAL